MPAPTQRNWILAVAVVALAGLLSAQQPDPDPQNLIKLNLPEQLELKVLIDYVAKRNGINFIYDSAHISGKRVTIVAAEKIPADSLMALLESVLTSKGLVLSPDAAGMVRISMTKPLTQTSTGPIDDSGQPDKARPGQAVTRVIRLDHAETQQIEPVIKPFLSAATANVTQLKQHGIVIVTDYASNMKRIAELIDLVDQPPQKQAIRFVDVQQMSAAEMAGKLKPLLQSRLAGGAGGNVTVLPEERTNQVIVLAPESVLAETLGLIETLDTPLGLERKIYAPRVASAERVDRLARRLIDELDVDRLYRSTVDIESNLLIVSATREIHAQLTELIEAVDRPLAETQSPIRFYKLENAKATDVLDTLRSIEGERGLGDVTVDGVSAKQQEQGERLVIRGPTTRQVNDPVRPGHNGKADQEGAVELRDARVMADEGSNTIIVIAKPSMHPIYEKLIRRLDVRRPQVLVEATIVSLDTTDGFSLGVEISHSDETANDGEATVLNFSSFGLSTVDPGTGRLAINPGIGFNGTLISADLADVVIRALQSDSRARVVSRPSVLINDNATGTLTSETEEPFQSVNASTSVATTSFGGYSSAGTKMVITPQISEGEHLKLEYEITLSSFGEDASDALPPSRQTNTLTSEATIPDGFTIIVGGLTREDFSESIDRVPLLGSLPVLEYLFSNRSKTKRSATLFVFIRAVILRDDKFESLKLLSARAARQAELNDTYPTSEAVEIP